MANKSKQCREAAVEAGKQKEYAWPLWLTWSAFDVNAFAFTSWFQWGIEIAVAAVRCQKKNILKVGWHVRSQVHFLAVNTVFASREAVYIQHRAAGFHSSGMGVNAHQHVRGKPDVARNPRYVDTQVLPVTEWLAHPQFQHILRM